jgi:uroporphyrinogen decarboxylase
LIIFGVRMPLGQILKHIYKGQIPPLGLLPEQLLDLLARFSSFRGRRFRLTPVERLLTTMRRQEPDHVPCAPLLGGAYRQLTGVTYHDFSLNPDLAIEAGLLGLRVIGGDLLLVGIDLSVEASDFGQAVIYPENSTPHPDYSNPLIRDWTDYRKLKRIDLQNATRMQRVIGMARRLVKEKSFSAVFVPVVSSPLSVLGMMRGTEQVFKDCINYPVDVMAALETITGVLIDYINALCDTGIIVVAPDMLYASQSGIGKELWEKIEGPFGRELANVIHRRKCLVAIHNCGDAPYFDSMIRFMEPEGISFARLPEDCSSRRELKKRYGDQTVLIGNVETSLLYHGSPHEVMEECRRIIEELADGGGFILAPGCEYPPNANLFNAIAMVLAAQLYG